MIWIHVCVAPRVLAALCNQLKSELGRERKRALRPKGDIQRRWRASPPADLANEG